MTDLANEDYFAMRNSLVVFAIYFGIYIVTNTSNFASTVSES